MGFLFLFFFFLLGEILINCILQTKYAVISSHLKANANSIIISMTYVDGAVWIADDQGFVYIWDSTVCFFK